jgi:hypothetical protein
MEFMAFLTQYLASSVEEQISIMKLNLVIKWVFLQELPRAW